MLFWTNLGLVAERYTLFPVEVRPNIVMTYSVHKNGAGLSRESEDIMVPGDYGLNTIGKNTFFCIITCWMSLTRRRCQAVLLLPATSFICEHGRSSRRKQPCALRQGTLLSHGTPLQPLMWVRRPWLRLSSNKLSVGTVNASCDSDALSATWVFPPFLGYKASSQHLKPSSLYLKFPRVFY